MTMTTTMTMTVVVVMVVVVVVVLLYCTVGEHIWTGFHCSVIVRWAAASPNPPIKLRCPPASKVVWSLWGYLHPAAGRNLI
jgi:hypothetical protein